MSTCSLWRRNLNLLFSWWVYLLFILESEVFVWFVLWHNLFFNNSVSWITLSFALWTFISFFFWTFRYCGFKSFHKRLWAKSFVRRIARFFRNLIFTFHSLIDRDFIYLLKQIMIITLFLGEILVQFVYLQGWACFEGFATVWFGIIAIIWLVVVSVKLLEVICLLILHFNCNIPLLLLIQSQLTINIWVSILLVFFLGIINHYGDSFYGTSWCWRLCFDLLLIECILKDCSIWIAYLFFLLVLFSLTNFCICISWWISIKTRHRLILIY